MLWLRPDIARNHPCAIDKMLVAAGTCKSLTEARREIAAGSVYVNNVKLIPPEEGFLPVLMAAHMRLDEYIALGITEELAEKILNDGSASPT